MADLISAQVLAREAVCFPGLSEASLPQSAESTYC